LSLMPSLPAPSTKESRKEDLLAWNREYQQKGRIWRGAPAKLPDLPSCSRVLELGCGNGKTLAAMLGRPWRIAAIDHSITAVRLGRDMATRLLSASASYRGDSLNPPKIHSSADFVAADAVSLPFRDATFDAVFAFHVIGHLRENERHHATREAARVLKAKGSLFFLEFGVEDMRAGKGEEVEPNTFRRGGGVMTHHFTEAEVLELFQVFRPVSIRTDKRSTRIRGRDYVREEVEAMFIKVES